MQEFEALEIVRSLADGVDPRSGEALPEADRCQHPKIIRALYVAAHELAHLKEMNHGPRFWETVESIFPEFRDARAQLRAHPPELLPTF